MLKNIFCAGILLIAGMLVACNQLTQFAVSEQTINEALQKREPYHKKIGIPGLADANIVIADLQVQIGRTEPNQVIINGTANVDLASIIGSQSARMKLTLKAQPSYDAEKGAIYLRDAELVDYEVTPAKVQTMISALSPYLNQSLKLYFNQRPVYVLNSEKSKVQALAKRLTQGLEVKPGKLVISFTN